MPAPPKLAGFPRDIPIRTDPALLQSFSTDQSGRQGEPPLAMACCRSTADIQAVVRWAAKRSVPLVPVSSADGPRRRGDTVCARPAVIVDLSSMRRVIHADAQDAIAVIEPGVTFGELDAALKPHRLRSFRPLWARESKSVLAAFLEREPITTPGQHWDSADPLSAFELVFGNGDLFRTGGAALPGSLEENLARGNRQMIGTGPMHTDFGRVLQGAQGALGIVAWASIYCQRMPALTLPLFAVSDRLEAVVDLAYRLLRRRSAGELFVLNGVQFALMVATSEEDFRALAAVLPPWILWLELSAAEHFAAEALAYRRADAERDAAACSVALVASVGRVTAAQFAERHAACTAPLEARLGRASQEVFFLSQMDRMPKHLGALSGEPGPVGVYVQPLAQGVNAHCQFTLLGEADATPALASRAVAAARRLAESGGFFSRPYHPWAHVPFEQDRAIQPFLRRTKQLFDPQGVLQPGAQSLGVAA